MKRVAAILDGVTLAPIVDRLLYHAEALRQHRTELVTRLDLDR